MMFSAKKIFFVQKDFFNQKIFFYAIFFRPNFFSQRFFKTLVIRNCGGVRLDLWLRIINKILVKLRRPFGTALRGSASIWGKIFFGGKNLWPKKVLVESWIDLYLPVCTRRCIINCEVIWNPFPQNSQIFDKTFSWIDLICTFSLSCNSNVLSQKSHSNISIFAFPFAKLTLTPFF